MSVGTLIMTNCTVVSNMTLGGESRTNWPLSGITNVSAGSNVSIDYSNPLVPTISATGGGGGTGASQELFVNFSTNFSAQATYTLGNLAGSTQLVSVVRLDVFNSNTVGTNFTVAVNGIPLATNYTIGARSTVSFEKFGYYPSDELKVIGDSGVHVQLNYLLVLTNQWGAQSLAWGTSTNNLLPSAVPSGQFYRVHVKVFNTSASGTTFTLFLDKGGATNLVAKDYTLGARSTWEQANIFLNGGETLRGYGTNCVSHVIFERR